MSDGRLPCATHPLPDELLSSWLVRLANAHRTKAYTFGRLLFPNTALWNRDVDKMAPPEVLHTLAARTSTSLQRIQQTTLPPLVERLTGEPLTASQANVSWLMPLGIYHRTHRYHGLTYCPQCLGNDGSTPYYRTRWRLAFHVVCPTCGVYLQEKCPACGAPIIFFRIELGRKSDLADRPISTCYRCSFDLSQAPTQAVSIKTLRRYRSLYRISREGWNRTVPYPHQYLRVLRQLVWLLASPFEPARSLQVDMRLRFNQPAEKLTASVWFERLPISERIRLLEQAMWLLEDWPDRFTAVMRYHRLKSSTLLREMKDVPFWFHAVVAESFYVSNVNRQFRPLDPPRLEKGRNQFIAPLIGPVGGPCKQDPQRCCPRCNSHWISRNGFRRGKQQYECQQCRKGFVG